MAYGNEVMLALRWEVVRELATGAWIDPHTVDEATFRDHVVLPLRRQLNPLLLEAHLQIIRTRFDPNARVTQARVIQLIVAQTPQGPREFSPFTFECVGEQMELGDRWPDDYVCGVRLSGRYYPVWLDWEDPHGGGAVVYTCWIDDSGLRAMMEEARTAIVARIPEFARAEYIVKMTFY